VLGYCFQRDPVMFARYTCPFIGFGSFDHSCAPPTRITFTGEINQLIPVPALG
jgi:hypothetical protein